MTKTLLKNIGLWLSSHQLSLLSLILTGLLSTQLQAETESAAAQVDEGPIFSMESLLEGVRQGRVYDAEVNRQRLIDFKASQNQQKEKLSELNNEKVNAERLSAQLEGRYQANDEVLVDLEQALQERLGSIKELFGVLQLVSSDTHAQLSQSISNLHYPDRGDQLLAFAQKMGQTRELPGIQEIESLWYELQREMQMAGQVRSFTSPVVNDLGIEDERTITRVGLFNLVSEGNYLQYIPETGRVLEYSRQPASRYLQGADKLSQPGLDPTESVMFSIDPTRGQLLSLLVQAPSLKDRISQGGVIGYIIIALGCFSVALALQRLISLTIIQRKVSQQVKNIDQPGNNPLGRILGVYNDNLKNDHEALELKLGEAILKEVPRINRSLPLLKIIAAIAPLMGLLGTVTGMIITFQAITLFGAGDPKLMANGISQALVTTVLGLTVAIPTLLMHNLVQTRARHITDILEQESVSLIAAQAEAESEVTSGSANATQAVA